MSNSEKIMRGIPCPECGCTKHSVKQTFRRGGRLERRRKCTNCGHRFKTTEMRSEVL